MKIMFVCHGNICRSPMAEFIFKDLIVKNNRQDEFVVKSSAVSSEELGNPVYFPAKSVLKKHGINCDGKYAVKLQKNDYDKYDLFLCMDKSNVRNALRIFGEDALGKVKLLLEFDGGGEVEDPWYTGSFDVVYDQIYSVCQKLLEYLN